MNETQTAAWFVIIHVWAAVGMIASLIAALSLHVIDGWLIWDIGVMVLLPIDWILSLTLLYDGRARNMIERFVGEMDTLREIEQQMGGPL